MPYLESSTKAALDEGLIPPSTPGHLNYAFTTVILDYIELHGLSYQILNDVIGALEACKLETYRRLAVPYENSKAKINGDVFEREDE